jgi:hypothetical protein
MSAITMLQAVVQGVRVEERETSNDPNPSRRRSIARRLVAVGDMPIGAAGTVESLQFGRARNRQEKTAKTHDAQPRRLRAIARRRRADCISARRAVVDSASADAQ